MPQRVRELHPYERIGIAANFRKLVDERVGQVAVQVLDCLQCSATDCGMFALQCLRQILGLQLVKTVQQ